MKVSRHSLVGRMNRGRHAMVGLLLAVLAMGFGGCGDRGEEPAPGDGQTATSSGANRPRQSGRTTADTSARYVDGRLADAAERPFLAADHPAPRPDEPLPYEAACITPECHASFRTRAHPHGPVGNDDCQICHEPDVGGHVYPLTREGDDLCLYCHSASARHTHTHAALESVGCIGCHDPHASSTNYLLKAASVQALCLQCHTMPEGLYTHGPVEAGECVACHAPHGADNARLLRGGEGPGHCFQCHTEIERQMAAADHGHEPAAADCLTCHQPHAADHQPLLKTAVADGCMQCHEPLARIVEAATVRHAAVVEDRACAACHDPHAAGYEKLLRDRGDRLCYTCHDRPQTTSEGRLVADMKTRIVGRSNLHGPVAAGQCAGCHEVHGSRHNALLTKPYPQSFYADFDVDNYALCFGCHDEQLVMTAQTQALTGFRDGQRNLHYLHVHRDQRGRTCRTCHEVHASDLPNHMARTVPFEDTAWQLPINYQKGADGGSCAPGCHEAKTYRRAASMTEDGARPGAPGGAP